jgi:hypothetical protein
MVESASHEPVYDLDMGARGDFRHDTAIGCVLSNLAQHLVRENPRAAIRAQLDDGRRRLVAGGFEAKNAHIGVESGEDRAAELR